MNKQSNLQALDFGTLEGIVGGASYYYTNNNGQIDTNMSPEMQQSFGITADGGLPMPAIPSFPTTLPSLPGFDFSKFGF